MTHLCQALLIQVEVMGSVRFKYDSPLPGSFDSFEPGIGHGVC